MGAKKMTLKTGIVFPQPKYLGLATVLGSVMLVSACTKVPDAINPVEWYKTTSEFVTGDDNAEQKDADGNTLQSDLGTPPPGAEGATPNLARIDDQMAQRKKATAGLSADTTGRKYADSVQRQSDGAQNSLYAEDKAPAAPQITAQQVAPAPMPATPVASPKATPAPFAPTAVAPAPAPVAPSPTATAAAAAPDPSFGVDPGMRDRLVQQLAEIQARAADQGSLLSSDLTSNSQGQQTVIISSVGIETSSVSTQGFQLQAGNQQLASLIQGPVSNNGALPLPAASTKVATILFRNGSAGLDATDRKILADVARIQRKNGSVVRVIGHASARTKNMDPSVQKRTNFKVSEKRANQVATELKRMGISSEMILTAAVGDNHPVYLEVMPSGEAGNRRTEIYLSN
ncbi:OmpA family protein [Rhodospirillales bacterium]|nr:OmpA family protein [Rhodospirillales bacterium]